MKTTTFALVTMVSASAGAAQDYVGQWGALSGSDPQGAIVCAFNDPVTGNLLCLGYTCAPGKPLGFAVGWIGGGAPGPGAYRVEVEVDGVVAATLSMQPDAMLGDAGFFIPYEDSQAGLVHALRGGTTGRIRFDGGTGPVDQTFTLAGAGPALAHAGQVCPRATAAAPAAPAAPAGDPVAVAEVAMAGYCADQGAAVQIDDGFVTRFDFDGDGREDIQLDYQYAGCAGERIRPFCGSAGCRTSLFHQRPDGSFATILDENVRGLSIETETVLHLNLHGNACGESGAMPCFQALIWDGTDFIPAGPPFTPQP